MARSVGIVISASTPSGEGSNKDVWLKPTALTIEWYEYNPDTTSWELAAVEPIPVQLADIAAAISTHAALPNAHHPANVGVTGSKVVGGYRFTFTNGLLTGFEVV